MQNYERIAVSLKPHSISDLWFSCDPWSVNEIARIVSTMPLRFLYADILEITVLTCKMEEERKKTLKRFADVSSTKVTLSGPSRVFDDLFIGLNR